MRAFMVLIFPMLQNGDAHFFENAGPHLIEDYMNINNHEQEHDGNGTNAAEQNVQMNVADNVSDDWFEVEVEPDVKSCMALNRYRIFFFFFFGMHSSKLLSNLCLNFI